MSNFDNIPASYTGKPSEQGVVRDMGFSIQDLRDYLRKRPRG